jgi:hypothetical protein
MIETTDNYIHVMQKREVKRIYHISKRMICYCWKHEEDLQGLLLPNFWQCHTHQPDCTKTNKEKHTL